MKNSLLFLGAFFLCLGFSSCTEEDVKGLVPAFDVDLVKIETIPVHVDQTDGEWVTYSYTTDLNIVNSDTEDYLNKIKQVKVNNLSYKIINFNGDPNGQVEGSFSFANQVSMNNSFMVQTAAQNGTVYQVNDVGELNRMANALKSGQNVMVECSGNAICNDGPMDFTIEVTLNVKVTIDP
jgi:hypothetical protein